MSLSLFFCLSSHSFPFSSPITWPAISLLKGNKNEVILPPLLGPGFLCWVFLTILGLVKNKFGVIALVIFYHCYSKTAHHSESVKRPVMCPCLFTTLLTRVVEVVCVCICVCVSVFNCLTVLGDVWWRARRRAGCRFHGGKTQKQGYRQRDSTRSEFLPWKSELSAPIRETVTIS